MKEQNVSFAAEEQDLDERLDRVLARRYESRSRQYIQGLLRDGLVKVNGKRAKASAKLKLDDKVEVTFPPPAALDVPAVKMKLDIVYEDGNVVVVNKPAGMVVHPGEGSTHLDDTLVNALLYHCKGQLSGINGVMRPGIVHRLDKDTSGLIISAKNDMAHRFLAEQFHDRKVDKVYTALLVGHLRPLKGSIEAPIGRDPKHRKRMAVVDEKSGRPALSRFEVVEYIGGFTLVKVALITGRMHQIRVHCASIGFPLAGDDLYGSPKVNAQLQAEHGLERQFLHAGFMALVLPGTTKKRTFECPLPNDLQLVLDSLKG